MTDTQRPAALDPVEARRAWAAHRACIAREGRQERGVVRATVRMFLARFAAPRGSPGNVIDPRSVLQWLIDDAKGKATRYVADRLAVLDDFLKAQVRAGLLDSNPLAAYRDGHGNPGWMKMSEALRSDNPEQALAELRPSPHAPGPIADHVRSYLALQRALGKKCRNHQTTLTDLDHFLQAQGIDSPQGIDRDTIERWMGELSCGAYTRARKAQLVHRFFDYLRCLSVVTDNPVPRTDRIPRSTFRPFIFTREQLAALLDEAKRLPERGSYRCRPPDTYFTMLALLCALGLRHGEVLRLRLGDVDLEGGTLFIDQTKFHKSRYVPFGPKVGQHLERHLEARRAILRPALPADLLFTANRQKAMHPHTLLGAFRDILHRLGIAGAEGQPPPRVHDIRHSFAVGRLLRWYQEGVDVQARLPALATFLGHVGPKSTEVYLTITSELLQQASARFHREFGHAFDQEPGP
jgi:site-specific recombinase XerD